MKKIAIGIAAIAALIGQPALAADMPVKAPPLSAPPIHDWTGFYVGANVGYSWGRSNNDWSFNAPNAFTLSTVCTLPGAAVAGAFCVNGSDANRLNGVIGGAQAGYNWQTGNFLAGIEADIQASDQKGNQTFSGLGALPGGFPPVMIVATYTEKLPWLATARGRIGVTADRWLVYATGGAAFGEVQSQGSALGTGCLNLGNTCAVPAGGLLVPAGTWSSNVTRVGWTAGVGVEGAIGANWSLKVEYLHVDLGSVTTGFGIPSQCINGVCGGFGTAAGFIPTVAGTGSVRSRITDEIVRVGINYKFGGPVVARY